MSYFHCFTLRIQYSCSDIKFQLFTEASLVIIYVKVTLQPFYNLMGIRKRFQIFFLLQHNVPEFFIIIGIIQLGTHYGFAWLPFMVKITDISLISLNIRNYLLRKYIKISRQFVNFYAIYSLNNHSRFWISPVKVI